MESFKCIKVLGRGTFGSVHLVYRKDDKKQKRMAMKTIKKEPIEITLPNWDQFQFRWLKVALYHLLVNWNSIHVISTVSKESYPWPRTKSRIWLYEGTYEERTTRKCFYMTNTVWVIRFSGSRLKDIYWPWWKLETARVRGECIWGETFKVMRVTPPGSFQIIQFYFSKTKTLSAIQNTHVIWIIIWYRPCVYR